MNGGNGFSITDLYSYNNLTHAFAGATGSVVAMSSIYPFDTVRTRVQGMIFRIFAKISIQSSFSDRNLFIYLLSSRLPQH